MTLFIIHCGYYDEEVMDAIYEFHVNIPVAADSIEAAKDQVRQLPLFQKKKMHIDGIQEIKMVSGYRLNLVRDELSVDSTVIDNHQNRDF